MGYARWDATDWVKYTASRAGLSRSELFASREVPADLDPAKFRGARESRDSAGNPSSNAVIIAADVTGSMGMIAEALVRRGIGITFEQILSRAADPKSRMLSDPHLMVMGIGDVTCDRGPVQATQFETNLKIAEQTERIWLEGGGGGNDCESYDAAWYMAAQRTSIDCFEKRGKKGYLFTVGDESVPYGLTKDEVKRFFGDDVQSNLSAAQLLAMAEQRYQVFHVIVEQGSFARRRLEFVKNAWRELMGQHVLLLGDYQHLAEVIVSAIQVNEGHRLSDVASTWSGDASIVVAKALGGLATTANSSARSGVVRL